MPRAVCPVLLTCCITALGPACHKTPSPPTKAAGEPEEPGTKALHAAATALQRMPPVARISTYLLGYHPMKDDPTHVMEAHHMCAQLNEDLMQCVLFDASSEDAHMNGVEYIISETLFKTLPEGERRTWHPHNYEILSGQLVAPGLPDAAEKAALARKMNSYGKTWHLWNTGMPGKPGDKLPLGDPRLAWSFNADGEMPQAILAERDRRLGIDTGEKRRERADLARQAHPQEGVDALARAFPGRSKPEGVAEAQGDSSPPAGRAGRSGKPSPGR